MSYVKNYEGKTKNPKCSRIRVEGSYFLHKQKKKKKKINMRRREGKSDRDMETQREQRTFVFVVTSEPFLASQFFFFLMVS